MADMFHVPLEIAYFAENLTTIDFAWFLAWNIADGRWAQIGLDEAAGRSQLLSHVSMLQGEVPDLVKNSGGRLQQQLMALRRGTFEQIQREAPFSRQARRNMEVLLRAWREEAAAGFEQAWKRTFPAGWEAVRIPQEPIRIVGEGGESEERALETIDAPDREARVAAEWWYKFYTFGSDWSAGLHLTTTPDENGAVYSIHEIELPPDIQKWIYFRLPRGLAGTC